MEKALFRELVTSVEQALEHAQGKRALRTTELPDAPTPMTASEIKALRAQLHASQAVFARYLNVSTKLVQAWEAGRRQPEGAALRLLRLGDSNPKVVFGRGPRRAKAGRRGAMGLNRARPVKRKAVG